MTNRQPAAAEPRVSVVIPCHNYVQYLDEAIASALSQDGVTVDVTIVDDASTDGSRAISEAWVGRDSRVRLFVHEQNCGHIVTFNEALDHALAPYVMKLDPDDVLTPGSLRRSVDVFEAHPEVGLVYGPVLRFTGETPTVEPRRVRGWKVWRGEQWLARLASHARNPLSQPELMMRRSTLLEVGGHREEVPATSDFHLWLRFAAVGSVARISGPIQGLFRVHANSMQATIHAGYILELRARRKALELFFDEYSARLGHPERLAGAFKHALARDAVTNAFLDLEAGRDPRELLEEAAAIDPTVTRTVGWRSINRQLELGASRGWSARLGRIGRDLKARIRWRMWRRFGI